MSQIDDHKFLDLQVFDRGIGEYLETSLERRKSGKIAAMGLIIGHTHWDREWYLPFEGFRARLVAMLDGLLDMLERDAEFSCFVLDGQTIMLEDYLEVRPEAEKRVRQMVSTGRLVVGPWYTATDTLLPDPESIVRNLQLGRWVAQRFGGEPMPVGYMPDLFGFSGQIPQILRHFGIESAFAWRGLHPENEATACWWQAPDGSKVLTIRAAEGYSEAAMGAVTPQRFLDEALPVIMQRYAREAYPDRFFVMGSDHFIASDKLPWLAAEISKQTGLEVEIGSHADLAELIKLNGDKYPTITGEQRHSCLVINPASVAGTRIPLKQANQRVEALLLGIAEPLQALAELVGAGSDRAHLRWAWRLLTQNHPHDSIPGCGIDEVHREMETRFARARMAAIDLTQRGAKRLASALSPATRGELGSIGLVGLMGGRERLRLRVHGSETGMLPFRLTEQDGTEVPFTILAKGSESVQYHRLQDAFTTSGQASYIHLAAPQEWVDAQRNRPHAYNLPWLDLEIEVDAPKAGYRILRIEKAKKFSPVRKQVRRAASSLENEHLRVWADEQGLYIEEKRTARTFGPLYFSHAGEKGDEYTACPLPEAPVLFQPDASKGVVLQEGLAECLSLPIKARVPARLKADRKGRTGQVTLEGKLEIRLQGQRADLKLELLNKARNYDLRLVAQVPNAESAFSGAPYSVEERPFGPLHDWPNAPQKDLPDFPLRGWLAARSPEGGLAVLARGLCEGAAYQTEGGVNLALTLLRGVDYLSRPDLETRPGDAGPAVPTPDAQCLGPQAWELALLPFVASEEVLLPARAEQFLRPPALFPVQWSAGKAPGELSVWNGDEKLVVSALKPVQAEEEAAIMLHAYNPTRQAAQAEIAGLRCRLDETLLPANDKLVESFAVTAWKIKPE
ncbi:MAG TPA: hypothetical protein VH186_37275 [Chloroflexia bacterium]|nr:hypothetical protein [Chloroflexia bacterium]